jgi:hypothetical protein
MAPVGPFCPEGCPVPLASQMRNAATGEDLAAEHVQSRGRRTRDVTDAHEGGFKMGLLQKVFGRNKEEEHDEIEEPRECTHATLVARWDDPDDIGKEEKATSWQCSSCNESFTPEERREIEAAEAERVRLIQQENEAHKAELERQEAEAAAARAAKKA